MTNPWQELMSDTLDASALNNPEIAVAVQAISEQIQSGRNINPADLQKQFPECAEHLNKLLPTLKILARLNTGQSTDLIGGTELGEFTILREIGRGGMGVVYEAQQKDLERTVAVKVLPSITLSGETALARFRNEAKAAAILDHPNIVSVLSVGAEKGNSLLCNAAD